MSALVLADVIKSIRDLPSMPVVVMELLNSFEQPDISMALLAEKVSRDQALAAKTLRLANSSFYGLQHKVNTIQQAVAVLGFDSVRTLTTAAAVIGNFSASRHASFDFNTFWRHSIGTALCAKKMAQALKLNQDYAFISGLLHDIGKLVLVTRFPEQYQEAMTYRAAGDGYMLEAERKVLGLDHMMAGQALAEYWKFPLLIQKAIGNHHAPETQHKGDIPSVIHVADAIVHALDLVKLEHGSVPEIVEGAWNSLDLTPAMMKGIFRDTEAEFEEASRILGA